MKLQLSRSLPVLLVAIAISGSAAQTPTESARKTQATHETALLRPGDIVRLRIWREPDLSGDFNIEPSGLVVFPKIGTLQVSDFNEQSLKDTLVKSYGVYLRNPSIDVVLLHRINVLGAVRNPGLYPVDPTMTLSDVVAAAGGPTALGRQDQVQLIRDGQTVTTNLTAQTQVNDLHLRSGDQLFVPERGWLTRNSGVVAAALTASVSLLIALFR